MRKICLVTPCYNGEAYISDTVRSILENQAVQRGTVTVCYVVSDGASTDRSVEIVSALQAEVPENVEIIISSESDQGMYDALARGFRLCEDGDIFGYLGVGDYLSPNAFDILPQVMTADVHWVTGLKVVYNEAGHLIEASLPSGFRPNFIEKGLYGTYLRFIQTESTFWDASLHRLLDLEQLAQYKLAGDYYIWKTFAQQTQLYLVRAWLGGFRHHRAQLSTDKSAYLAEFKQIRTPPRPWDYLLATCDRIVEFLPEEIRRQLHRKQIIQYNPLSDSYE